MPIPALRHVLLRPAAGGLCALAGMAVTLGVAQQPTFRTGVDLVTVDVSVLDGSGRPVEGLTADDFEVRVERAPRKVVWAEYVRQFPPTTPVVETAGFYDTNETRNPGRLILVAVDQGHIRRIEGRSALRAAAGFVDALDPGDRVAAAPLNHGGPIQFTGDHASVKKYLQTLTGEASPVPAHFNVGLVEALAIADGGRTQLDQVVRRECGQTLGRLENPRRLADAEGVRDPCPVQIEQESRAMAQLARTDARLAVDALQRLIARLGEIDGPKALVLISEGLVAEAQLVDLTALGAAAQAARVTIYVLQLEVPVFEAAESKVSPSFQADLQVRADGLSRLAGSARGALFRLVGADPFPFRRILTELGGHYLVAFEATDSDRDGQLHRIDVATKGSAGTVRARPSFRIPVALPAPSARVERLLRSPRLATELPVRLAAYTLRAADRDGLKTLVALETDLSAAGRMITTGFVLVNDEGVIVASNAGSTDTGRYTVSVALPPGRYLLRAAAVEPSGRQGSVERKLDVKLNGTGAVRVSDLILAEPSDVLIPSIVRSRGDRLLAYLEMYGPAGWSPPEGSTVAVTPADGSAVLISVPAVVRGTGAGRWIVRADIPFGDLPPGHYRATARLAIGDVPGLTRPFVVGGQ